MEKDWIERRKRKMRAVTEAIGEDKTSFWKQLDAGSRNLTNEKMVVTDAYTAGRRRYDARTL